MSNSEPPEFRNRMREMIEVMKRHGTSPTDDISEARGFSMQEWDAIPSPHKRPMRGLRGQGITRPVQNKSKRRAKGKAQRRARKVNRSRS